MRRVVFLTFDDGPVTDPGFPRMVRDLELPVALFLTSANPGGAPPPSCDARAPDELRALGAGLYNHTLDHRDLRTLDDAGQRAQICGQRDRIAARFGSRPRLFRPPYGAYDATTLRAAKECGVAAVVLARATMTADGPRYAEGARSPAARGHRAGAAAGPARAASRDPADRAGAGRHPDAGVHGGPDRGLSLT